MLKPHIETNSIAFMRIPLLAKILYSLYLMWVSRIILLPQSHIFEEVIKLLLKLFIMQWMYYQLKLIFSPLDIVLVKQLKCKMSHILLSSQILFQLPNKYLICLFTLTNSTLLFYLVIWEIFSTRTTII